MDSSSSILCQLRESILHEWQCAMEFGECTCQSCVIYAVCVQSKFESYLVSHFPSYKDFDLLREPTLPEAKSCDFGLYRNISSHPPAFPQHNAGAFPIVSPSYCSVLKHHSPVHGTTAPGHVTRGGCSIRCRSEFRLCRVRDHSVQTNFANTFAIEEKQRPDFADILMQSHLMLTHLYVVPRAKVD